MGYTMTHPLFVAEIRWPAVWVPVACTVQGSKTHYIRGLAPEQLRAVTQVFFILQDVDLRINNSG
jgi:cell wall assembly regulator SMI1